MQALADILGARGPLARHLSRFTPRSQQQEMAEAIAATLRRGGMLVAEAGTGTGKTFAYLAPVLEAGVRTVISTGTRALQDQLFHRDLPVMRAALASPARVALLKGRSNYLCLYRLELAGRAPEFDAPATAARLHAVRAWAGRSDRGEIGEFHDIPAGDPFWQQVTSTTENCLGQECPAYSDCHVVRARRAAQEADVVVINHYLLFSDILLRQEGYGELLPEAEAFVIDEAHQLPEIASRFFGLSVSGRQLAELARDAVRALRVAGGAMPALEHAARVLERSCDEFRRALGGQLRQAAWRPSQRLSAAMQRLRGDLEAMRDCLETAAGRDKGIENCWRRAQVLCARVQLFAAEAEVEGPEEEAHIRWLEGSGRSFSLHVTPLDFAAVFRDSIARYRGAWVFTSATLAVGEHFTHFTSRLGIEDADAARWDSPFDYARNTLCYLPAGLPEPGSPAYVAAVVAAARPVLETSGGRAFMLFTSHHGLREAARLFEETPPGFPVFVQGDLPHQELLERFRAAGNGVLLGTGSFWEGVDVRGPALSCVIIDKLPFAPPDDPVFQARAALIRAREGNPFRDHQLPAAVIALKQGVGRLIRDVEDRGLLMLCDPRILSRSYGRIFLDNLPAMPRTRDLAEVAAFFAEDARAATAEARACD